MEKDIITKAAPAEATDVEITKIYKQTAKKNIRIFCNGLRASSLKKNKLRSKKCLYK